MARIMAPDGAQIHALPMADLFRPPERTSPIWSDANDRSWRSPILTFTGGIHTCMGAHLARLEMKIALQEWLRRTPDFDLRPGAEIRYAPSGVIGPVTVPLVW